MTSTLRTLHVIPPDGRLLSTTVDGRVAGITYNFLPFMVLPLYVSLEQIDPRLIEAAQDLYASRLHAFLRVTVPLSLPGDLRRDAAHVHPRGRRLHQRAAARQSRQWMIGNVIQSKFLAHHRLPVGGGAVLRADARSSSC